MKSFCIIGLGRFGRALAETLSDARREVLVIDHDEKNIESVAETVDRAVIGDCTDEAVLRAAGAADYDCAVICISENVNDSVLTAILLKELGCRYVIARAADERHAKVLEKVGADQIILPESDIGRKLGRQLSHEHVRELIEFSDDTTIVELEVPREWIGKTLVELDVRKKFKLNVILHKKAADGGRGGSVNPFVKFMQGDLVTVAGADADITRFLRH